MPPSCAEPLPLDRGLLWVCGWPPRLTFAVADTQYVVTFLGLLIVGLVISTLPARVREQVEASHRREQQIAALYSLSRDLAGAGGLEAVLEAVVAHVGETFGRGAVVVLPRAEGLKVAASTPALSLGEDELAVASWAFEHSAPAGEGTDTLSAASMRSLPLTTARGTICVLAVRPADFGRNLGPEQRRLLEAFASQAAIAIERTQLAEQASQVELLSATEKLQTALLNSISHDLRTPLASITGVLSSLRPSGPAGARPTVLGQPGRRSLGRAAGYGAYTSLRRRFACCHADRSCHRPRRPPRHAYRTSSPIWSK